MSQAANSLGRQQRPEYSDLVLAAGVLLIMGLMVFRLPTPLIDALVAVNISTGVCLLLIAIYVPSPVMFNSFPSVLLISTLFRLALSVATTRLILLEADAGNIIHAFGSFVAGGNLVVGIVVFIIITVVQFIVIAKGAERVAEVSARFTLDAMPGKQLSIDSDLRSGLIEKDEAKCRRRQLESENQLNGALDGAMKFVKGDAIASIIIVVVNLVGGLTIGMAQRGLEFGSALEAYSILTIGDGMVAQIPALLSAMAAGLVVTRTTGTRHQNLGATIARQLSAQPRALLLTAAMALLLALTPGFPSLIFISIAAVLLLASGVLTNKGRGRASTANPEHRSIMAADDTSDGPQLTLSPPLLIELDPALMSVAAAQPLVDAVRQELIEEYGAPIPVPDIVAVPDLTQFRIRVFDVLADQPGSLGDEQPGLEQQLRSVLQRRAGDFLGIQEVTALLDMAMKDYPALVREVNRHLSNQAVAEVLRHLIGEGIPIRNLRAILEAIAAHGERERNTFELAECARLALRHLITELATGADGHLHAVVLSPESEAVIRAGLAPGNAGVVLSLPTDVVRQLRERITEACRPDASVKPVIATPADIRRHIRALTAVDLPDLHVVSFAEILPDTQVDIATQVSL